MQQLTTLDRAEFLQQYWQRNPLYLSGALPGFAPPLSADELAGLALEQQVESRIICQRAGAYSLRHGPFEEADFAALPERDWTLLVQAVDHYSPEVGALRDYFDFLPRWRFDDIMVSYAVDGGSVGPHWDNYDVFLLQGEGRRLWRVGQDCGAETALVPHAELCLLRDFHCREEYLLEPGDLLYLPPRVAHWGIAVGECTTFSIGFRAPRLSELVSRFADALLEELPADVFYRDPGIEIARRAGEIRPSDLHRVRQLVQSALAGNTSYRWFGELVTEPRYTQPCEDTAAALRRLQTGASARPVEGSKLAWLEENGQLVVFANGASRQFSRALLPAVEGYCAGDPLAGERLLARMDCPEGTQLLDYLLDNGCLYVK